MATRDLKTTVQVSVNKHATISTSTTTNGTAVDTVGFLTLTYALTIPSRTDGTYALVLLQSDDDGVTDAYAAIPAANLIGSLPSLSAATTDGAAASTVGVFGNKRYVKPTIVSTSVTTGATAQVIQIAGLESIAS